MSPTYRNGPQLGTEDRPDASSVTTTASITRRPGKGRRQRAAKHREAALTCRVSLLAPAGRRTRWWYLATCPACGAPHLGRARELADVTGTRRLPCRHWVVIVVARTYGRTEAAA